MVFGTKPSIAGSLSIVSSVVRSPWIRLALPAHPINAHLDLDLEDYRPSQHFKLIVVFLKPFLSYFSSVAALESNNV